MLKRRRRRKRIPLKVIAGRWLLLVAFILIAWRFGGLLGRWFKFSPIAKGDSDSNNSVLQLVLQTTDQRESKLEAIAKESKSLNSSRARYLRANDLLQQNQAKQALEWLEGLESDYPVLAAYVAVKRAQAYEISGDNSKALSELQKLVKQYPKEPVIAEALFLLGKKERKYWQQAIAQFPSHPRTVEIASSLLKENPSQLKPLLIVAKYAPDSPEITSILDRVVRDYGYRLKARDWEEIAIRYWQKQEYGKASVAYQKSPLIPANAYRVARGLEISNRRSEAKSAYELLVAEFPKATESGASLIKIANLSEPLEALPYLDQAIGRFPDNAGEAVSVKAKMFDQMKNTQSAQEARRILLTQYGNSEAASEYRWNTAQQKASAGDIQTAWQLSNEILTQSPDSTFAPRAGFWAGKWAMRLGRQEEAKAILQRVVVNYPQSYYAWRSASLLGLDVGDINTVRDLKPEILIAPERAVLPSGSPTLKELYKIGQDRDAWAQWQAEFQSRSRPTVSEQFTNSLMLLAIGENQQGISQASTLEDREAPNDKAEYQALRKQSAYWQALYPLPYIEIIQKAAQENNINSLLVVGVIRQESRFMPKVRSIANATGLMQVIPATGKWVSEKVGIKDYNPENPTDNIRVGSWYLAHTHDSYKNNSVLALASYNAGPGNVSKWLNGKTSIEADEFVEVIPFEETRWYVKQVLGNHWNYLRLYNPQVAELMAKQSQSVQQTPSPTTKK